MIGDKPMMVPIVRIDHDRDRYMAQVELPGVKREDIELEVTETSFCIHAEKDDAAIIGCYFLAHPVNVDEADAAFDGKLLNIQIPFKGPIRGRTVDVREGTMDFAQVSLRMIDLREGPGNRPP